MRIAPHALLATLGLMAASASAQVVLTASSWLPPSHALTFGSSSMLGLTK